MPALGPREIEEIRKNREICLKSEKIVVHDKFYDVMNRVITEADTYDGKCEVCVGAVYEIFYRTANFVVDYPIRHGLELAFTSTIAAAYRDKGWNVNFRYPRSYKSLSDFIMRFSDAQNGLEN